MDWFEKLTGFRETSYDDTRAKLAVEGNRLRSLANGRSYGIGELELVSLGTLRKRAQSAALPGRLTVRIVRGDVRAMHGQPENAGALFQVASQFNLLEMTSYNVTPEHGVTRYQHDRTQGPACAIAAGAATIYRNYFAPVRDSAGRVTFGQTRDRQIDALSGIGLALVLALNTRAAALWTMRNGYALCTQHGLKAIADLLATLDPVELDDLRSLLYIGLHRDVEVTGAGEEPQKEPQTVSQAFCSALPVAYSTVAGPCWKPFASLILQAAYEATMWAAVDNARRGASNIVLLTSLGGGAFGNDESWICDAMERALTLTSHIALDVRIVSYGAPGPALPRMAAAFA